MEIENQLPAPNVIRDADAFNELREKIKNDLIPVGGRVLLTLSHAEHRALFVRGECDDPAQLLEVEVRKLIARYGQDQHGEDRYGVTRCRGRQVCIERTAE